MSDAGGPAGPGGPGGPGVPEYTPEPPERGLWARFLASPTWVKIALPVAVVILAVLAGVLIAQAGDNSSDEDETEELLEEIAEELADEEAATTTTIPVTLPSTTTVAETTTTVEETTTTIAETTTTAVATTTTVPAATTTVPVAPTTTTTTTTTTTVPATTTTSTTTTTEPPPTEAPPTTEAPPDTEPPDTEAPDTEPPDTEPSDTEAPDTEPPDTEPGLPPEALFGSLDDLQSAWNATAQGTSVAPVDSWTPTTVLDRAVNVANLGGNLRLAAVANDDGFVTHVVLAWLPLADDAEQPQQNAQFQDAFAVLVRTVNPGASSSQQAGLAADLGISAEQPPFPEGAEARAALPPDRYQLKVVDIPSQDGPTTLIAATSAR